MVLFCCLLFVVCRCCCPLYVAGCSLFGVCRLSVCVCVWMLVWLFVGSLIVYRSSFSIVRCSLFAVRSLFVVCCLLFVVRCSLFAACCLLVVVRC